MSIRTFITVVVMGVLCTTTALAEVPHYINFQGTLTDTSGNPLNETIDRMTFSIYADSVGGNDLWSESYSNVPVNNGLFYVTLGSRTALPPAIFNDDILWLGIMISPDPLDLSPRQRIVTVPYGFKSLQSDTSHFAFLATTDNDWTMSGNNIYRTTGNVGIGTSAPTTKLQVTGGMKVGYSGSSFLEIRQLTGTTTSTGSETSVSLPSGYSGANCIILTAEINILGGAGQNLWYGIGYHPGDYRITYRIGSETIWLVHPNYSSFQEKPYRIWLMKIS
jgi:hypothetical protein